MTSRPYSSLPTKWLYTSLYSNGFNCLFGQSEHLVFFLSQKPYLHSFKQAVEVLQIHNNYISNVSGLNQTDDAHVNSNFTKYLSELSVLLVKEGEKIPTDETEFKKFMADRMEFWKDIDLQTAVNIEAWFENYYKWLETDPENFYYFNNKDPQTKEEAEAMNKARAYNREIYQKIGAKSIVSRLIEIGTFNGLGRTNMESANEAPFTDAVKAISIENSKL